MPEDRPSVFHHPTDFIFVIMSLIDSLGGLLTTLWTDPPPSPSYLDNMNMQMIYHLPANLTMVDTDSKTLGSRDLLSISVTRLTVKTARRLNYPADQGYFRRVAWEQSRHDPGRGEKYPKTPKSARPHRQFQMGFLLWAILQNRQSIASLINELRMVALRVGRIRIHETYGI